MTTSIRYILPLILLAVAAFIAFTMPTEAEVYSDSCTVSTTSAKVVGNQTSQTILATSSARAWASIQRLPNETNSTFVRFDNGASATVNNGFLIGTTTNNTSIITFGRNTDFPYVGAVTGITSNSSTTVLVTECNY